MLPEGIVRPTSIAHAQTRDKSTGGHAKVLVLSAM